MLVVTITPRVDQYVIDEHDDKSIQERPEHPVHQIHECRRGIRQAEGHNKKLVMPVSGAKSSLRNVLIPNPQLVVPRSQVDLRKSTRALQLIEQIINAWQWVLVSYGHLVKLAVIDAESQTPIFLLHEQQWSTPR